MNENLKMRGWKVWYANGSVYSSKDYYWQDLPYKGVQAVVIYEDPPPYRTILTGGDWYYLSPKGWMEKVPSESWEYFRSIPCGVPHPLIKKGTGVSDEMYEAIKHEAWNSREF